MSTLISRKSNNTNVRPRGSYIAEARYQHATGELDPRVGAALSYAEPIFRAPLQPSEVFDLEARGRARSLPAETRQAAAAAIEANGIRAQRGIDRKCRAFASEVLQQQSPRQLDAAGETMLAELTALAGEGHSTIRWIRDEVLAHA
jgi:hypothetical protein